MNATPEVQETTDLDLHPEAGALGVEVRGLNVREVDEATMAALRVALAKNSVLFFPKQNLSMSELKSFGRCWGELAVDDSARHVRSKEDPDVVELKASAGFVADVWHTDLTPMPSPPFGSILSMKTVPPAGGDTMWSSQFLAYETLSQPIREMIGALTALHSHPRMSERSEHPMVITHPVTGRKALFVNRQYTKRIPQLSPEESDNLLNMLFTHAVQPHFTTRRRWSTGDVAVWDNLYTQHFVISDFVGERVIQRVTVKGQKVEKLNSPFPFFTPTSNTISQKDKMVSPTGD